MKAFSGLKYRGISKYSRLVSYFVAFIRPSNLNSVVARNIYAWSNTPLGKVKVVIIGQGEYCGVRPSCVTHAPQILTTE